MLKTKGAINSDNSKQWAQNTGYPRNACCTSVKSNVLLPAVMSRSANSSYLQLSDKIPFTHAEVLAVISGV